MKFHKKRICQLVCLGLSVAVTPAGAATTCDAGIAEFSQQPVTSVVDPALPDAGPSVNREQGLKLFAQGYELCKKGLEIEGVTAINEAIALLNTP